VARLTLAGGLDGSFATGGIYTGAATGVSSIFRGAVQPDGKVLFAYVPNAGGNLVVGRLTTGGVLDATFGTAGLQTVAANASSSCQHGTIIVAPDGSIFVSGCTKPAATTYAYVVKLQPNGTPDPSWGSSGISVISTVASGLQERLALQDDGKVVLVDATPGNVMRLTINGALDTTFNGTGVRILGFNNKDLAIQPDGNIVVTGNAWSIARLTPAGAVDGTFNPAGTDPGATRFLDGGVTLQGDGKILLLGDSNAWGTWQWVVERLNANGSLDTSFGTSGYVHISPGANEEEDMGHIVHADGKIYVSGRIDPTATNQNSAVLRLGGDDVSIPDYLSGSADWSTGSAMFGVCLRAVSSGATTTTGPTPAATWQVNATCPTSGAWNGVPTGNNSALAKVAQSTTANTTTATAALRFGMRIANNQAPGTYIAPITFEVVAPNA
jgi:uncharacterized delta-60 repeat protein